MAVAALAGSTAAMAQRHDGSRRDHGNDRGGYERGGQQGNWGGRNDRGSDRGYERRDDRRWNDRDDRYSNRRSYFRDSYGYGYGYTLSPNSTGILLQDGYGRSFCDTPRGRFLSFVMTPNGCYVP